VDSRRRNVLIGLFVLGGLAGLGILIVKFGESKRWFGQQYIVFAKFDRITGVREGTEVLLAGVSVGNIRKIELAVRERPNEGVLVAMEIAKEFPLPKGSVATVETALMGQARINVMPPLESTDPLPMDGTGMIHGKIVNPLEQVIDPRMMATLEKTTAQIGKLAETLTPAAEDIHNLLRQVTTKEVDTQGVTANFFTAVERLHNVLKHFDTVLGDPNVQSNVRDTVANLKASSDELKLAIEGFKKLSESTQKTAASAQLVVDKLSTTVDTTQKHIDDLGKSLISNSDRLSKLLDYMVVAGRDLAEGKGKLGMLLRDVRFYEELLLTIQRLGLAAADMQVVIKQWQDSGFAVKLR
jgi:phospholipid/cholesterol/gamma-HCH transport system substrate-binding protein